MKKLEELGISQAPWRCICYHYKKNDKYDHLGEVRFADNQILCCDIRQPDAKLASAAPDLYDGCFELLRYYEEPNTNTTVLYNALRKIKEAMAKAAGEDK